MWSILCWEEMDAWKSLGWWEKVGVVMWFSEGFRALFLVKWWWWWYWGWYVDDMEGGILGIWGVVCWWIDDNPTKSICEHHEGEKKHKADEAALLYLSHHSSKHWNTLTFHLAFKCLLNARTHTNTHTHLKVLFFKYFNHTMIKSWIWSRAEKLSQPIKPHPLVSSGPLLGAPEL